MHLQSEPFFLIRRGAKKIEARINDPKRQSLNIGDIIELHHRDTEETFRVRIIDLIKKDTFTNLLNSCDVSDFGYDDKDEYLKLIYSFYSKEEEAEWGVVGIVMELVK